MHARRRDAAPVAPPVERGPARSSASAADPSSLTQHARARAGADAREAPPPAASVIGTYRSRPPFVAVTWPFQSDRCTQSCRLREIDIAPLERHHLAAPQPRFPTQQHDQVGVPVRSLRRRRPAARTRRSRRSPPTAFGIGSNRIVHGIRSITSHSTAFFSSTFSTVSTLLTVFGAFVAQRVLEPLHVFVRDRVEPLVTEQRHQMHVAGSSPSRRCRSASADWPARGRRGTSARTLSSVGTSFLGWGGPCCSRCRSRSSPHRWAADFEAMRQSPPLSMPRPVRQPECRRRPASRHVDTV